MRARAGWCIVWLGLALSAQDPAPRSIPELQAFYQQNCARCHGADGSGRDGEGRRLKGLDFTESTKVAQGREIRALVKTIRNGIFFGKVMPAWKVQLSEAEAERLVREVVMKAEKGKVIGPSGVEPPPVSAPAAKPQGRGGHRV